MQRPFAEIDVFTAEPYRGNPLAVVLDGSGLSTDEMQRFANWTNFSETTFLMPPTDPAADYRVRIFTTSVELPFAGHPTLGSCHAWLGAGGVPATPGHVVQECAAGLITIRTSGGRPEFAAPPMIRSGPVDEADLTEAARALGIEPAAIVDAAWIDNGPGWLGVLLDSAAAVLALEPTITALKVGVIGAYPTGSPFAYEVRGFFPTGTELGEDPVTGSLNASAAQWLIGAGRFTAPYVASQGTRLGRAGRVYIDLDADGQVWVGGDSTTCVQGTVDL